MRKTLMLLGITTGVILGCTQQQSPTEMWTEARELTENEQYDQALELYQNILSSDEVSDTLLAKTHFTTGDLYLNHFSRIQKALEHYETVVSQYPASSWGPKAQFMVGYVYANHIHDYKKAERQYNYFLEIYPTHELVEAVNFELSYLGKDLDDIDNLQFLQSIDDDPR